MERWRGRRSLYSKQLSACKQSMCVNLHGTFQSCKQHNNNCDIWRRFQPPGQLWNDIIVCCRNQFISCNFSRHYASTFDHTTFHNPTIHIHHSINYHEPSNYSDTSTFHIFHNPTSHDSAIHIHHAIDYQKSCNCPSSSTFNHTTFHNPTIHIDHAIDYKPSNIPGQAFANPYSSSDKCSRIHL